MTFSFPRSRKTIVSEMNDILDHMEADFFDCPGSYDSLQAGVLRDLETEWQEHPVTKLETMWLRLKFRVRNNISPFDDEDIPF